MPAITFSAADRERPRRTPQGASFGAIPDFLLFTPRPVVFDDLTVKVGEDVLTFKV